VSYVYCVFSFLVSKTVEELILEWKPEDPITIYKKNIQMSMFELIAIVPNVCNESFQIGKVINGDGECE